MVAIPVTFLLTAIISSLLSLLTTYMCLTRRGTSHKLVQEPVYDPDSLDHVLKPPVTRCTPVPSTRGAIGIKSNEAYGQSGDIVYESVLPY